MHEVAKEARPAAVAEEFAENYVLSRAGWTWLCSRMKQKVLALSLSAVADSFYPVVAAGKLLLPQVNFEILPATAVDAFV